MDPVCATDCEDLVDALPEVLFDDCNPEINAGEIQKIYLGIRGVPFADIEDPVEWAARLASVTNTKLIQLTVIADKPKPAENSKEISGGRKVVLPKDHVINVTIDETNPTNHEFIRKNQCSGNYQAWYETSGGRIFGGNAGLRAFLEMDMTIPRERNGNITYDGTLSWKERFTEEMAVSPIA